MPLPLSLYGVSLSSRLNILNLERQSISFTASPFQQRCPHPARHYANSRKYSDVQDGLLDESEHETFSLLGCEYRTVLPSLLGPKLRHVKGRNGGNGPTLCFSCKRDSLHTNTHVPIFKSILGVQFGSHPSHGCFYHMVIFINMSRILSHGE